MESPGTKESFEIQNQIRENSNSMRDSLLDLQDWEHEIKMKEKSVKGDYSVIETSAPVRSRLKSKEKEHIIESEVNEQRVTKIIDESKLIELSLIEKEKGNDFFKVKDYEQALLYYSKAIELYTKDTVYLSNRAMCYLKTERYQECIEDCNKALLLDETNNKAIHRRMLANELLKNYESALQDCGLLMQNYPTIPSYKINYQKLQKNLEEQEDEALLYASKNQEKIDFIVKAPHLRSKKQLKNIMVTETGERIIPNLPKTEAKICENERIPDDVVDKIFNNATGESVACDMSKEINKSFINNQNINKLPKKLPIKHSQTSNSTVTVKSPCSEKYVEKSEKKIADDAQEGETVPEVTRSGLEFQKTWREQGDYRKYLYLCKIADDAQEGETVPEVARSGLEFQKIWRELGDYRKYLYLKKMSSIDMSSILSSFLDSDNLAEILNILQSYFLKNSTPVHPVLLQIAQCKELNILSLFFSSTDKDILKELCNSMEIANISKSDLDFIKSRFGL